MSIETGDFVVNTSPRDMVEKRLRFRSYTWNSELNNDLSQMLNVCRALELENWDVCLESPVDGIQRNYRIPVLAVKQKSILIVKPVSDAKKVNVSGLKMLDVKTQVQAMLPEYEVKVVIYAFLKEYDATRRTNEDYEIWLRG